jgi:hypothetical protein
MKDRSVAVACGVALGVIVFALFAIWFGATGDDPHPVLPACIEEDGSTQKECIWDDGSGLVVHNWDYGKHYETWART